jgi:xanthine dehydrogenase YagS FAD-binding subunit
MKPFSYIRAPDTATAIRQANATSKYLAGGTNLIDFMKLEVETPEQVVDIGHVPLDRIEITANGVRIGAMVRNSDLAYDDTICERYPVLSEALLSGATAQVRNMATVGGNLLQRTRCTYFRDLAWNCNKRNPGSGCAALDGYNRSHAILGTSDKCIATHPSDMCVAMVALDAVIFAEGPKGKRRIAANDFFVPYGDDPSKENTLDEGEMIVYVELPNTSFFRRSHYLKVRDRASFEFALASAAVAIDIDKDSIVNSRIALGGVATRPWRSTEAEKRLTGAKLEKQSFVAAAEAALQGARPQEHNAFKIELAKRTLIRALETASGRT